MDKMLLVANLYGYRIIGNAYFRVRLKVIYNNTRYRQGSLPATFYRGVLLKENKIFVGLFDH